MQCNFVLLLG